MPDPFAGKSSRPAWWGFFISAGVSVLLLLGQYLWRSHVENGWPTIKLARQHDLAEAIRSRFDERIDQQRGIAQAIIRNDEIAKALKEGSASSLARVFQLLEDFRTQDDVSIDLVDSSGHIIAWSGRSVVPGYGPTIDTARSEPVVLVSQASLHRYLSVGLRSPQRGVFAFVSTPLETNYPVSNRFVSRQSFADELSQQIAQTIRFAAEVTPRDTAGESSYAVPLKDNGGRPLSFALVPLPTVAGEIQKADRLFDSAKSLFAAAGICFLVLAVLGFGWFRENRSSQNALLLIVVWGVRLGLKYLNFPSLLVGGFLFDPAVQSSPFPLGLASSLGELSLSTVALLLTMLLLMRITIQWIRGFRNVVRNAGRARKYLEYGIAGLFAFGFQWIVRGYGAAMRSFVFDSTIQYHDPMSLIPNLPMVVMHFNILLLTAALLIAGAVVFIVVSHMLGGVVKNGRISKPAIAVSCVLFLIAYALYLVLDQPAQLPVYLPLLLYVLAIAGGLVWEIWDRKGFAWKGRPLIVATVLIGSAFLIGVLALDAKTHEKEHERTQLLAEELLRPVDNWLSLIVSESLRGATTRAFDQMAQEGYDSTASVDLAFSLWAQTLMSKEGYNSALVVYNSSGKELSRFSVGLTSYEQMELLSQVFHKEEEALLVVDRKVADGSIKYYGEWRSVLASGGEPLGTIAVLMSASQRTLFRGEAPEQLRTSSQQPTEYAFRKITISEYRSGELWTTNDPVLFRGMKLPPSIERGLANPNARFVWSEEQLEGRSYDVLYASDEADRTRVIALSLEALDVRWHVFNLVKTFLVYLLFIAVVAAVLALQSVLARRALRFGFREKLITSLAILSILPLILMALYNRELAIERLDDNITRRLSQDLDVIQQRFSMSVVDEQDFSEGVNNDFCEAVASDLGVDFSVYQGSQLKATSRPELYRASILDSRLTGTAYVNTVMLGRGFYKTQERIGEVSYIVGYRPVVLGDSIRGVLGVPALYRQQEIEEELAQRNAFVLGAYAFVVSFVIGLSIVLANALSRPLRDLSRAARSVGKGDLDIVLKAPTADEVGDLIRSFNDMTSELKASRASLARAERELAWKEMAKQVAHEIKNPLTPIKLSIQHLVEAYRQGAKNFGDVLERVSQTVVEQIEVLTRIASEFSNFARMPERQFERVDLSLLLRETIDLFKEVRGITFRADLCATPAIVVADRDELRRVFINIVRNSVQAMDRGGAIDVSLVIDRQICTIRIADTGIGIPDDIQAKVFQPNFSTKTDGMGLGLAIAQKVIEDLNGTIRLESKMGQGTTVEMKIPLRYS